MDRAHAQPVGGDATASEAVSPLSIPAAPAPVPVLSVGHAEDRAEADADTRADRALSRLAALSGESHQHGPGCDHLRRSVAVPSRQPVVGREGGDLDAATTTAINQRRGTGSRLEPGLLRRMETAFDTSLTGVRVHTDGAAAALNDAVSARAFTTGQDIFFGAGEFAPQTPEGSKVLAHEIAHTLQASGVRRMIRRRKSSKAKPKPKPRPFDLSAHAAKGLKVADHVKDDPGLLDDVLGSGQATSSAFRDLQSAERFLEAKDACFDAFRSSADATASIDLDATGSSVARSLDEADAPKMLTNSVNVHVVVKQRQTKKGKRSFTIVTAYPTDASVTGPLTAAGSRPRFPIDLQQHEDLGGHAIDRHVGKSVRYLYQRLKAQPAIPAASTFDDVKQAETMLKEVSPELAAFAHGANHRDAFVFKPTAPRSGGSLSPDDIKPPNLQVKLPAKDTTKVTVDVTRDGSMDAGFRITDFRFAP